MNRTCLAHISTWEVMIAGWKILRWIHDVNHRAKSPTIRDQSSSSMLSRTRFVELFEDSGIMDARFALPAVLQSAISIWKSIWPSTPGDYCDCRSSNFRLNECRRLTYSGISQVALFALRMPIRAHLRFGLDYPRSYSLYASLCKCWRA